jgi:hypothetical protein
MEPRIRRRRRSGVTFAEEPAQHRAQFEQQPTAMHPNERAMMMRSNRRPLGLAPDRAVQTRTPRAHSAAPEAICAR